MVRFFNRIKPIWWEIQKERMMKQEERMDFPKTRTYFRTLILQGIRLDEDALLSDSQSDKLRRVRAEEDETVRKIFEQSEFYLFPEVRKRIYEETLERWGPWCPPKRIWTYWDLNDYDVSEESSARVAEKYTLNEL